MSDVSTWLRSASSRRRASVSASVRPGGSASGAWSRIVSGTARSTSSSSERRRRPRASRSISARTARRDGRELVRHRRSGDCARVRATLRALPRRRGYRETNGNFVTIAGAGRPRMSTTTASPIATSGRQERERDPALEHRREVPARDLADACRRPGSTGYPRAGPAAPSSTGPGAGGATPRSCSASSGGAPRKSPLSKRTTQPSPPGAA